MVRAHRPVPLGVRYMSEIHVGDIRYEYIDTLWNTFKGTVVYVHPRNRYYTVQFQFEKDSFRESYTIERLEQK